MKTTKTATGLISDGSEPTYREMIRAAMCDFLLGLEIGDEITKEDICKVAETDDWKRAYHVFLWSKKKVEDERGVLLDQIWGVGYKRVDHERGVDLCEKHIKRGMKQVGRGVRRTYNLDLNQLSDSKRNRVIATQAAYNNIKLLQDLSGE